MLPKQYFKFRALFFFQAVIYLKMEATHNELTRGERPPKVFQSYKTQEKLSAPRIRDASDCSEFNWCSSHSNPLDRRSGGDHSNLPSEIHLPGSWRRRWPVPVTQHLNCESSWSLCRNTPTTIFQKCNLSDLGQSCRKGNLTVQRILEF